MHVSERRWRELADQMAEQMERRSCHPFGCVVLVPFAQLVPIVRQAWLARAGQDAAVYLPQIETTQTWAQKLWAPRGGFQSGESDYTGRAARDTLTAWRWLSSANLGAFRRDLGPTLMETARSIWRLAAAQVPADRSRWVERLRKDLIDGMEVPALAVEATVAQLALAWVGTSAYPTDVLHQAQPDLLFVIQGWQTDPLVTCLAERLGDRAIGLALTQAKPAIGRVATHACQSREEQAQYAAACVIRRLSEGRQPVALIAQDRALTRRIVALLATRGMAVRDETGWTLSTTRAAAALMALLRAARPMATCDQVLDWLGELETVDAGQVQQAQAQLRQKRVRFWKDVGAAQPAALALGAQIAPWLLGLRSTRSVGHWLQDLKQTLMDCGQWSRLHMDPAGRAVLKSIGLDDDDDGALRRMNDRLTLAEWTEWVGQAMESSTFAPEHPAQAQLVLIPLGQLLGRAPAAVVLPGADERHLPVSPELPGPWNARQRRLLGLPDRQQVADAQRAAWLDLLSREQVDVLWHIRDEDEDCMPSALVRELQLSGACTVGEDPRVWREVCAQPVVRAQGRAGSRPIEQLSASAYEDLRACPYRFFAQRLLGLSEAEELDGRIDGRDLGRWLHEALRSFHQTLQSQPIDEKDRLLVLDRAAQEAMDRAGLDPVALIPHQASWPLLRDAYLRWLARHEAEGHRFEAAESWHEAALDEVRLVGRIDRVDRKRDGEVVLIDYKTESQDRIKGRVRNASEDTQLAFYAALRPQDRVSAIYLSLADRGEVHSIAQPRIHEARDLLRQGVLADIARLHDGQALVALGQGESCQYCRARGLCRRDFVSEEVSP